MKLKSIARKIGLGAMLVAMAVAMVISKIPALLLIGVYWVLMHTYVPVTSALARAYDYLWRKSKTTVQKIKEE